MSEKWALKAVFLNDKGEKNYTLYDEVTFESEAQALWEAGGEYGEILVSACDIDCRNEPDLQGFYFDDLVPYRVEA